MADALNLGWIWHECIAGFCRADDDIANVEYCCDNAKQVELFGYRKPNNIKSVLGTR
jgi:hypothetical protein